MGEEGKLIAHRKIMNVQGGTVYKVPIYEGCISVEVNKSEDDEYVLFRTVKMDDLPIRKMEEVVGNFILWPTKYLRHVCRQL